MILAYASPLVRPTEVCSPWKNWRMVLALVSMTHFITSLPNEFRTAIKITSPTLIGGDRGDQPLVSRNIGDLRTTCAVCASDRS
jgi:hypothetical protein